MGHVVCSQIHPTAPQEHMHKLGPGPGSRAWLRCPPPTGKLYQQTTASAGLSPPWCAVMVIPVLVPLFPFESLVHHVVAHCRVPYGGHPGLGTMPESEEVLGHGLVAPMALKAERRSP